MVSRSEKIQASWEFSEEQKKNKILENEQRRRELIQEIYADDYLKSRGVEIIDMRTNTEWLSSYPTRFFVKIDKFYLTVSMTESEYFVEKEETLFSDEIRHYTHYHPWAIQIQFSLLHDNVDQAVLCIVEQFMLKERGRQSYFKSEAEVSDEELKKYINNNQSKNALIFTIIVAPIIIILLGLGGAFR